MEPVVDPVAEARQAAQQKLAGLQNQLWPLLNIHDELVSQGQDTQEAADNFNEARGRYNAYYLALQAAESAHAAAVANAQVTYAAAVQAAGETLSGSLVEYTIGQTSAGTVQGAQGCQGT